MGNSEFKERCERAKTTKILSAHECKLDDWEDVVNALKTLTDLRSVSLASNKLEKAVPRTLFQNCVYFSKSVKTLDLSGNKISDLSGFILDPTTVEKAKVDTQSFLSMATRVATVAKDRKQQSAPDMLALEVLNLSNNRIGALPVLVFASCPRLKQLDLSHNPGIGAANNASMLSCALAATPSLNTLDMSHCALTTFPFVATVAPKGSPDNVVQAMQPVPSLSQLNLQCNSITHAAIHLPPDGITLPALLSVDMTWQGCTTTSGAPSSVLVSVDPTLFALCPNLNAIKIENNAEKEKIFDRLRTAAEYQQWAEKQKDTVSKQIHGGANVRLID